MANLLDQASIVLTPTAYDNGKVLCAKPSEAPYGDFDFSRNSAATRVNAQGLVENVQILSSNLVQNGDFSEEGAEEVSNGSFSQEGSELITNGDFTNGTTGWSSNATLTESNNIANITTTSTATVYIRQNNVYEFGKRYKLTFTAKVDNLTEFELYVGSTNAYISTGIIPTQTTDFQEYNFYFQADTAGGMNLLLRQSMVANSSIEYSEISVREVGQDWDFVGDFEVNNQEASITNASQYSQLTNQIGTNYLLSGKAYKLTADIETLSISGALAYRYSGGAVQRIYTTDIIDGRFTAYFTMPQDGNFWFQTTANYTGLNATITNISVKEVGMDWTLGTGVSIGSNEAVFTSTPSGQSVGQNAVAAALPNGALAKVSFEVLTRTEGTFGIYFSGTLVGTLASAGVFTGYFTKGTETSFYIRALGTTSGTISNVNVIQITDDTNLPRINYEGFSYQDDLGSEEIVNGGFDNGTAWILSNSTISNGKLNISTTSIDNTAQQSISGLTVGANYKIEYDINSISSGGLVAYEASHSRPAYETNVGTYSNIFTATATTQTIYIRTSGATTATIDNVSVKEYLGQSVVPNSGCGSWLFEPQSTNLILRSQSYTSNWGINGTAITENIAISPDGSQNGGLLKGSTASQRHYILASLASVNVSASLSFFAKAKELRYIQIACQNTSLQYANFDIQDGVVGNVGGDFSNAKIEDYGNGWYRCSVVSTNRYTNVWVSLISGLNSNWLESWAMPNNTDGLYIYGFQTEQQPYATSYIPTSGSQVTRNQDLCNNGGTGTGLINSTEGVLYAEIAINPNDNGTFRLISMTDASNSVRISFGKKDFEAKWYIKILIGALNITREVINFQEGFQKIAIRYKSGDSGVYINGTKVITNTSNYVNTLIIDNVSFNFTGLNFPFFGKTKAVAVWKEALSDQELAELTYPTPTDPTFTLDFDTIAEQFTFARGSEATYVDAQGLIQSTNELGEELVVNGDFDNGLLNWIKIGSGEETVVDGQLILRNTGRVRQDNVVSLTKTYKGEITISGLTTGSLDFYIGSSEALTINSNGIHTFQVSNPTDPKIYIYDNGDGWNGYVDNVSVKEVISATNTPRLDYSTGAEAFLLEPQSTNLVTQSELLIGYWSNSGSNYLTSDVISPDGASFSKKVTTTSAGNFKGLLKNESVIWDSKTLTISTFAKRGNTDWLYFYNIGSNNGNNGVWFNLDTGLIGSIGAAWSNVKIETFKNGWYRCSATLSFGAATNYLYILNSDVNNSVFSALDNYAYIWGTQVEELPFASSYIPSNGSQTTRNQETCINATPEINSEQGVLYAEISALADGVGTRTMSLSDGTANNSITIRYTTSVGVIQAFVVSGGSFQFNANISGVSVLDFNKVAIKYSLNDMALWINGVEVATDTSGAMPLGLSEINFTRGDGANKFFGNTKDLQYYPKALSDAELIKLTT